MAGEAKNILQSFLRRLTNLSGNNRALVLLRLVSDQFIDVHTLSHLNGVKSFELISSLVRNSDFRICALHDSRLESNNLSSQKLKMLQRIDRFVFEERGTNDLHVGWPFVRGKFSDGTLVRCPLLYFPVSLVQKGQYWVLEPRADAGVTFNKTFLLAYAFYHKIKVDEELLDFSFEDFDKDITVFRTQLYQLLNNRIELNFNTQNFTDELTFFAQFKRAEFEEEHRTGELKLFPEAVLGIFPQSGSQLVPDYLHLLEEENFDLERFFTKESSSESLVGQIENESLLSVSRVREEKLFTPFPLDAHQENAIHQIKNGKSIVVQGPPGTGKSQLICNLMADAMAEGKKVLLVCQKRAALDVVYDRMQQKDLAPFIALVHDFRNDRRLIFDKIARQIERIEEYKSRSRSADVIQTDRRFVQVCRTIDQVTEELQEFKDALYNDKECGIAVKQLYLTSAPDKPFINLKQEYHFFTFPIDEFLRKLRRYVQYANLFEHPGYIWRDRKSFAGLQASDEHLLEEGITEILTYQKSISTQLFRLVGVELDLDECEALWFRHEEILGMLTLLKDDTTYRYFQRICNEEEDETSLLWLSNMERVTLNCFEDLGPEVTIPTEKLGKFQEALYERMKTRGNLIHKLKWEFFSEKKFIVKRALVANDLAYNKYGLRVLEQRIDSRLNLEHHLTALKNRSWLLDLPLDYNHENLKKWFNAQKLAIRAKNIFLSLREIKDCVSPSSLTKNEFQSLLRNILDIIKEIPSKKEDWQRLFSNFHIRQIITEPTAAVELRSSLKRDFDNLYEFDSLRSNLHSIEENVIQKLYERINRWDGAALDELFQNSLKLAWIDHIELKYPILRSVSSLKMEELQQELLERVEEKQKLSLDILLLRAREHAFEGLTYNRLNNLVTYRDLQHQVTKKKKLWPLRKLVSTYYKELFQLIPCWMASPESVSAIFPMENIFDLVIFDEASQCFAERGLPAMYRGKQVLVAGDGQQLRPSELYQVRWTEEEEDTPDTEVESLLALTERYLPTVHLQGHYRSKSLELMEFSNRHFYENRLKLLPDREIMNLGQPAIEYQKVNGTWENQTNLEEANVVVKLVQELIRVSPEKQIGVVTFNAPQQNLILDILEETTAGSGVTIPETLFVKNIENVQGDEKDIIIFSVGYAPDKHGKMAMQFGSLNTLGGENRLNVAVTRAREKVIIITSVYPEQFNTQNIKNRGPRLLQQYLEYGLAIHQGKGRLVPASTDAVVRSELSSELSAWGQHRLKDYEFQLRSIPHADVNIVQDEKYLGVLLTDDDRFDKSLSIKDRFAYTPALLSQKNWKYRYVYSRQYWKDIEQLERSLMLFIGSR